MTDYERENIEYYKKLIKAYLPTPRDESLDDDEYYVELDNGSIVKGFVNVFAFDYHGNDLVVIRNGKGIIRTSGCNRLGYMPFCCLYDNKTDCRNYTHSLFNDWERLRRIEKEIKEQGL